MTSPLPGEAATTIERHHLTGSPVNVIISDAAGAAGAGEIAFAEFALIGIPVGRRHDGPAAPAPVATPANMMIMGPAGYRLGDYWRMGLPLVGLFLVVGVGLMPLVSPF